MDALYLKKERISVALSKQLIPKIEQKCKRINRNRSNYVETIIIQDLQKDENQNPNNEIIVKTS